jgi:histidine triad (HIT) family protein
LTENCIFCKIVKKQAPASIIYEDQTVLAFLDLRPVNEGHTLVIPKSHYETIYDIPEDLIGKVHQKAKQIAVAVKKTVNAQGISIIQQNERAANQDIFHFHIHVIPRFEGQKLPRFSEIPQANRERLEQIASEIKQNLP